MKYRPIFITETNTDISKTHATCKFIEKLSKAELHLHIDSLHVTVNLYDLTHFKASF